MGLQFSVQETLLELAGIDPSFQIQPMERSQHPGDLFRVTSVMENISSGYAIYLLNDEIQEFIARVGMKKIVAAMMTGDTTELNQSLKEYFGLTIEELLPNDERYARNGFARQLLLSRDFSERISAIVILQPLQEFHFKVVVEIFVKKISITDLPTSTSRSNSRSGR